MKNNHAVVISRQYVEKLEMAIHNFKNHVLKLENQNRSLHNLNYRLTQEIQKARHSVEIHRKELELLRDIRYEYEYAKRVSGSFLHESPI